MELICKLNRMIAGSDLYEGLEDTPSPCYDPSNPFTFPMPLEYTSESQGVNFLLAESASPFQNTRSTRRPQRSSKRLTKAVKIEPETSNKSKDNTTNFKDQPKYSGNEKAPPQNCQSDILQLQDKESIKKEVQRRLSPVNSREKSSSIVSQRPGRIVAKHKRRRAKFRSPPMYLSAGGRSAVGSRSRKGHLRNIPPRRNCPCC